MRRRTQLQVGLEESVQVEETSAAKAWGIEDLSLGNNGEKEFPRGHGSHRDHTVWTPSSGEELRFS